MQKGGPASVFPEPANHVDSGAKTAAPQCKNSGASGFAAGPEEARAAHAVDWFYALPPCRHFLRSAKDHGPENQSTESAIRICSRTARLSRRKEAEKIVAVSVLVLFAFLLATEDPASISGKVVDAITGAPLGKVQLRLEPISEAARQPVSATASDGKGEFSFVGVEPGLYHLTGTRSGYLPAAFGAKRPDTP